MAGGVPRTRAAKCVDRPAAKHNLASATKLHVFCRAQVFLCPTSDVQITGAQTDADSIAWKWSRYDVRLWWWWTTRTQPAYPEMTGSRDAGRVIFVLRESLLPSLKTHVVGYVCHSGSTVREILARSSCRNEQDPNAGDSSVAMPAAEVSTTRWARKSEATYSWP